MSLRALSLFLQKFQNIFLFFEILYKFSTIYNNNKKLPDTLPMSYGGILRNEGKKLIQIITLRFSTTVTPSIIYILHEQCVQSLLTY